MAEKESGKTSKKKSGRISGKKKSGRRPSARKREYARVVVPLSRAPLKIICSECYEEFTLDPKEDLETIVCPECDHGASAPSEEFLRKWTKAKKVARKKLIVAFVAFGLLFILGLVWMLLQVNPGNFVDNDGMNYSFFGAVILLTGIFLYFGGTYEASRVEAYF